jgi:hypothetical protein
MILNFAVGEAGPPLHGGDRLVPGAVSAKGTADGLQVRHTVNRIRLQVASFGPFVPCINRNDTFAVRIAIQPLPCIA